MARKVVGRLRATCAREINEVVQRVGKTIRQVLGLDASHTAAPRMFEQLEDRRMLAGVTLSGGVLKVSGEYGQRNTLTISVSGSNYIAKSNSISKTVSASSVSSIEIYGGDWNDTITIASGVSKKSYIDAREGNDTVNGGGGADKVYGDKGDDKIYGNGGNDSLYGEAGNDYVDGGSGTNTADGGEGTDTVKNFSTGGTTTTPSTPSVSVTSLQLWDTSAQKLVKTLTSGETLDLSKLPSNLSIVAQTSSSAKSVKFGLDSNSSYRTENSAPWAIAGDTSGKVVKWSLPTGSHTIKATAYTKTGATGTASSVKSITLNITKGSTTTSPPPPSTGGGSSSGGSGTGTTPVNGISPRNSSAASPSAVITAVSSKTIHAGQSFHANAMSSSLNGGTPITARYVWDFGDPGSKYNTLQGFNAAHYYKNAGTYTVKLTLTNEAGKTDIATTSVTVQSAGRKVYYVSNDGSDTNDGLSTSKPLKTFGKAVSKANDNVEILFKGDDTFETSKGMNTYDTNIVIGSYGTGRATIKYTGPRDYTSVFYLGGGAGEATIRDLTFDSIYSTSDASGLPQAIGIGGRGDTVLNCEFLRVGYAVNTQAKPHGVLVQENEAPLSDGLRDYFVWASGSDLTILGNYVKNVRSHVVRVAETDRINITDNDFRNPLESAGFRGTLTIHKGSYAYVANNKLTDGWFSVGPLGEANGIGDKSARWNYSVFEGNVANNTRLIILHGAQHTMVRNNVMKDDNTWTLEVEGYSGTYGRGVVNVSFVNNTVINNGTTGNFLRVGNSVNGINLINNLYVAPNLTTGTSGGAPVFVYDTDLSSFNKISGNVWPKPSSDLYAEGGINYVWPTWSNSDGYRTPTEWENFGQVIKDYYEDTSFNSSSFAPSSSSQAASSGVVWAGVFTDMNGKIRSNSGSWTAGAVEV